MYWCMGQFQFHTKFLKKEISYLIPTIASKYNIEVDWIQIDWTGPSSNSLKPRYINLINSTKSKILEPKLASKPLNPDSNLEKSNVESLNSKPTNLRFDPTLCWLPFCVTFYKDLVTTRMDLGLIKILLEKKWTDFPG